MTIWTDDDLDLALADLLGVEQPLPGAAQRIWTTVAGPDDSIDYSDTSSLSPPIEPATICAAAASPIGPKARKRTRRRLITIGLAVAAAIAGVIVIPAVLPASVDQAAAAALNRAAAAVVRAGDPVVPPGSYRYIRTQGTYLAMSVMAESVTTSGAANDLGPIGGSYTVVRWSYQLAEWWIPADPEDQWMFKRSESESAPIVNGTTTSPETRSFPSETSTASCGEVAADVGGWSSYCTGIGSWQVPTRRWLATLPTDSNGLFQRLRADTAGHGHSGDSEMLVYATDALKSGRLPARTRGLLYEVMARIPGIHIIDDAVVLDGRTGMAFAMDYEDDSQQQTIIDTATGDYLGERTIQLGDDPTFHLVAGQTSGWSSVTVGVASRIGVPPTP